MGRDRLCDKSVIENVKTITNENKRKFYTNFYLNDDFGVEYTANGREMTKKESLTSSTLIPHIAVLFITPNS